MLQFCCCTRDSWLRCWAQVDLDTIVMEPSIPLETFLDDRFDLIAAKDCTGINAGGDAHQLHAVPGGNVAAMHCCGGAGQGRLG